MRWYDNHGMAILSIGHLMDIAVDSRIKILFDNRGDAISIIVNTERVGAARSQSVILETEDYEAATVVCYSGYVPSQARTIFRN